MLPPPKLPNPTWQQIQQLLPDPYSISINRDNALFLLDKYKKTLRLISMNGRSSLPEHGQISSFIAGARCREDFPSFVTDILVPKKQVWSYRNAVRLAALAQLSPLADPSMAQSRAVVIFERLDLYNYSVPCWWRDAGEKSLDFLSPINLWSTESAGYLRRVVANRRLENRFPTGSYGVSVCSNTHGVRDITKGHEYLVMFSRPYTNAQAYEDTKAIIKNINAGVIRMAFRTLTLVAERHGYMSYAAHTPGSRLIFLRNNKPSI